jgi:hypothetical protein
MQQNFAIVSVFILLAALQGWLMYCADGVCPILLTIRDSVHKDDSAGNNITTIPATFAVLQLISTHENKIKTGLHQQ